MSDTILDVRHLKKYFNTPNGTLHAVDDVNFTIQRGKTLGVVGESGCGKSTTGRAILRLVQPTSGEVYFEGRDVAKLSDRELRLLRRDMQIIFQDPYSSLNPRKSVYELIQEPIVLNRLLRDKNQIEEKVFHLMETVGLAERLVNSYPHELDGGRRQRIGIARALAMDPKFVICDEPVSALDVSIQAQILNLLADLQDAKGLTYIFITHDLAVVNHFADDIAVMYLGQLVEKSPAKELFRNPLHPYTEALLSAIPSTSLRNRKERIVLKGEITSPVNLPPCCHFAERCPHAAEECFKSAPPLVEISPDHFVACLKAERSET